MWPFDQKSLKETYDSFVGNTNTAVQPLNVAAPNLTTTGGATKTFGTAPEKTGYTMAGGKRHRTRRVSKHKKTHKRHRKY